ncbi:MAG: hypothetical protein GX602_07275 [Dehalococcoidales bacterium]|nr:hypothetical protein [Dehalococcoidales bacterium]
MPQSKSPRTEVAEGRRYSHGHEFQNVGLVCASRVAVAALVEQAGAL